MKKVNTVFGVCTVGLVLLCTACSPGGSFGQMSESGASGAKSSVSVSVESEETGSAVNGTKQAAGDGERKNPAGADGVLTVGIVTYTGGIEDESFNQGAWEGLQRLSGAVECRTEFLESVSEADFAQHMDELLGRGGDLCWGTGYNCSEELLKKAGKNPEVSFAVVDYAYPDTPGNVTGVVFRAQESSFLAGFIAANVTETGRVGFVGGESNEVIDQFQYGYQAGVAYGAGKLGRKVEVLVEYAGSFDDPYRGKELAKELYGQGCDIVFHAAGETGVGVIEAAKEGGHYVIGADKDQAYLAPDNVLTSVLKNVNQAIYQVSKDFADGKEIGGQTVSLGLAEGAVGVSEGHALYPDEVYEQVLALQDAIIAGDICPPANSAEYDAFEIR